MQQIHEVIIIGAGISGIGASRTLSKQGIPHIILQSRDRFGGRIFSENFQGCKVDIGASFVHNPDKHNLIRQFMKEQDISSVPAELTNNQHYYYEDEGPSLKQNVINEAQDLFDKAMEAGQKQAQKSSHDLSISQAVKNFVQHKLSKKSSQVQDTVNWRLNLQANIEGIELTDMSAKFYAEEEDQDLDDLVPLEGGMAGIVQRLFQSCKTNLICNTRVVNIDLTGNFIVLRTTDNRVYRSKRVISSIPLGILQKNLIQFSPPLPEPYRNAINNIGVGIANKLFCSFKQHFWGNRKGWINFVVKGKKYNRYPIAFIYPQNLTNRKILIMFVGGKGSYELAEMTDEQIFKDLDQFLGLFLDDDEYEIDQVKMTRWHLDDHTYGSYCYPKVGTTKANFQQLRQPLQNRFWFVGEHTHPDKYAYAHGAYESGVLAARQAINN